MSIEGTEFAARFWLHLRCHNCHHLTARTICVPDAEDAPRDVEDLLESEFIRRVPFQCSKCENPIGSIVGVKVLSS